MASGDARNGLINSINTIVFGNTKILPLNPTTINPITKNTVPNLGSSMGAIHAINLFTPTSIYSDSTYGLSLIYGVTRSYTEGSPESPCLEMSQPGMYKFKWSVSTGVRTFSINCKQASNSVSASRPSVTIKANPDIGLYNDITGSASPSTDWVVIGPLSFSASNKGCLTVELYNNSNTVNQSSTFFDHINAT